MNEEKNHGYEEIKMEYAPKLRGLLILSKHFFTEKNGSEINNILRGNNIITVIADIGKSAEYISFEPPTNQ